MNKSTSVVSLQSIEIKINNIKHDYNGLYN